MKAKSKRRQLGRTATSGLDASTGQILIIHPTVSGAKRDPREILTALAQVIEAHPGEKPVKVTWIVPADVSDGYGILDEASIAGSVTTGTDFTRALSKVGDEIVVGEHRAPLTSDLLDSALSTDGVSQLADRVQEAQRSLGSIYDLTEAYRGDRTNASRERIAAAMFAAALQDLFPSGPAVVARSGRPRHDCMKLRAAIPRAVVAMRDSPTARGTLEDLAEFLGYEGIELSTSAIRGAFRGCRLVWKGELPRVKPPNYGRNRRGKPSAGFSAG
jgi:hypothetical protein